MSATPRTDAERKDAWVRCDMGGRYRLDASAFKPDADGDWVSADHARALETELNAVRIRLAEEAEVMAAGYRALGDRDRAAVFTASCANLRNTAEPVDLTKL